MQRVSSIPSLLHRLHNRRINLKLTRSDQRVNARNVHLHDASRADVQVAHFTVPHLSIGQPDKMIRGLDQRVGKFAQQFVIRRLARQRDCIIGRLSAIAPSVEDGEDERMFR